MNKKYIFNIILSFVVAFSFVWILGHLNQSVYAAALAINDQSNTKTTKTAKTTAASPKTFTIKPPIITIIPNEGSASETSESTELAARAAAAAIPSRCTATEGSVYFQDRLQLNGLLSDPNNIAQITNLIQAINASPEMTGFRQCTIPPGWKDGCPDQYCNVSYSFNTEIGFFPEGPFDPRCNATCEGESTGTLSVSKAIKWTDMSDLTGFATLMWPDVAAQLQRAMDGFQCGCTFSEGCTEGCDTLCQKMPSISYQSFSWAPDKHGNIVATLVYSFKIECTNYPNTENWFFNYGIRGYKHCKDKAIQPPPGPAPAPVDPPAMPIDPPPVQQV